MNSSTHEENAPAGPTGLSRAVEISDSKVEFNHLDERYFVALKKQNNGECDDLTQLLPELMQPDQWPVETYCEIMKAWLSAEEAHRILKLRKYDQTNVEVTCEPSTYTDTCKCSVLVDGLHACQPPVTTDDQILIYRDSFKLLAQIKNIKDDCADTSKRCIEFACNQSDSMIHPRLNVCLVRGRLPFVQCHNALSEYKKSSYLEEVVFKSESPANKMGASGLGPLVHLGPTKNAEVIKRLDKLNSKQRGAIAGILQGKCRPNPYIVFGAPGTGKTQVLIEAVFQIRARSSNIVLICTNYKQSRDLIADKLERAGIEVTRMNVGERPKLDNDKQASDDTDLLYDFYHPECTKTVSLKPVVVTTCTLAGNLRGHQFDYVFCDDAQGAYEAETLIAACRLAPNGCLVLLGDIHQLGPSVELKQAKGVLGVSMMERMLKTFSKYQKSAEGRYNQYYITNLLDLYRYENHILSPANSLFYDGNLSLSLSDPRQSLSHRILKTHFQKPLVWINNNDSLLAQQDNSVFGLFDEERVIRICAMVIEVIFRYYIVSRGAFGVITLCQDQVVPTGELLLRTNIFPSLKVKVDTLDGWQGDERDVVVVCLGGLHRLVGVDYDRLLHSAVSRARWIAIVVGDSQALSSSAYWKAFREHAQHVKSDSSQMLKSWI